MTSSPGVLEGDCEEIAGVACLTSVLGFLPGLLEHVYVSEQPFPLIPELIRLSLQPFHLPDQVCLLLAVPARPLCLSTVPLCLGGSL